MQDIQTRLIWKDEDTHDLNKEGMPKSSRGFFDSDPMVQSRVGQKIICASHTSKGSINNIPDYASEVRFKTIHKVTFSLSTAKHNHPISVKV